MNLEEDPALYVRELPCRTTATLAILHAFSHQPADVEITDVNFFSFKSKGEIIVIAV